MSNTTRWIAGTLVLAVVAMGSALACDGGHGMRGNGMLKQADADGDGVVTLAEAETGLRERTLAIDANKDGSISIQEMEAHRQMMRAERQAARLAALDADNNGTVSVEEFNAAHSKRLARMDRNGDGKLDAEDRGRGHGYGRGHGGMQQ